MNLHPVAFSFSGAKWDSLLTLSFFCWQECPRSLVQNSRKALLLMRFSFARSMALSVGLLFLWKALLKKKCLFINRLDHTVKYDCKKKKDTLHTFLFIFKHKDASIFIFWVCNDLSSHGYPFSLNSQVSQTLGQRLASRALCLGISHYA